MATMERYGDTLSERQPRERPQTAQPDAEPAADPSSSAPPPESGGSQAPPADAGDVAPTPDFPVPPVPPPPSPGPIFSLAGSGDGGPTSFARPGTAAAKPFRSPIFTANRSTAMPGGARFGAGTALAGGAASPSFLPAGLEGEGAGSPAPGDELRRILALMSGGQG